ncbi:MAG TPA: hypothetical protein VIG46_07490 [Candidatus Baltobacteraceae bacterium]|jgi:hypothetical protein
MSRSSIFLAIGAALLIGSTACSGGDKGPLAVASVQLTKDDGQGGDGDVVTGFHPADGAIHCVATLNKVESGAKVGLSLIAVNAGGAKNAQVVSTVLTTNAITNTADGKFTLPRAWPTGTYRCDVTLNGAPAKSVDFAVTPA